MDEKNMEYATIEDIKKLAQETPLYSDVEWNGVILHVKKHLSVQEVMMLVAGVVSSCFTKDTGEYIPELKNFIIKCYMVEFYAGIKLPAELSAKYDIIYGTDIEDYIFQNIDKDQYYEMLKGINERIEYKLKSNIEALNGKMNELVTSFTSIEKNLTSMFSGIDNTTMSKIAGAIANGSFDENKLVEAFNNKSNKVS